MFEQAVAGAAVAFLVVTLALMLRQGEPTADKAGKPDDAKESKKQ